MDRARDDALEKLSDPELVRLLVAGNHDAMTVIFDRYCRLVMGVALHIIHDTAEAEDVVQIVFTEFYQRAKLFDESKGNLRTWLLQYAYGRSFNQKRKVKRRGFFEHTESEVAEMESKERTDSPEPVFHIETQDAAILIEEILPHLSEKQRYVIQMAFFEGVTLSDVASQTGQPIGNIRHAYYRGIEKLRSLLIRPSKRTPKEANSEETRASWLRKSRDDPRLLTREVDIA